MTPHTITIVVVPDGGVFRASTGQVSCDGVTPERAALHVGAVCLDVTLDRVVLTRVGPRIYEARVRSEVARLLLWVFGALAIGCAGVAIGWFLVGGPRL